MLESIETRGIVLYNREFREDDKLVKIFTEKSGKRMFFVKHAGKSRLNPMLQPQVTADMLLKINDDGLSTLFAIVGSFVRITMIRMRDALTGIRMFSIYWISFKQYDSMS